MQDIDRPVGLTRHRLDYVDTEREQNGAEEEGHYNRCRNDVVMEDIQPAWQLKVLHTLLFFTQIRGNLVGNPRGELLLMADRETATVGHFLRRFVHHIGGNTPIE